MGNLQARRVAALSRAERRARAAFAHAPEIVET